MRPCPPNGLARAAWFRELAQIVSDRDPIGAAMYRATAESIERRTFRERPLLLLMEGGHVTAPTT